MQGTQVPPLLQEDPARHGATKTTCRSCWACVLGPGSHSCWAHVLQLGAQSSCFAREATAVRGPHTTREKHLLATTRESPCAAPKTQHSQKLKQKKKIEWKHERPWIARAILRKKNRADGIRLPDFRLKLQSYSHQESMILATKNRNTAQRNRTESPEINPPTYGQLIHNKGGRNIQWGEDSLINKSFWENWTAA